jgi:hypothetical protein
MDSERPGAGSEPAFFEVELTGPEERGHGFLAGLVMSPGGSGGHVFYRSELEEGRPLLQRLLRDVASGGACRAVVDGGTLQVLRRLASRLRAEAGLELHEHGAIRSARFAFRYQAYSPRHATEIRGVLASLPEGVRLEDAKESQTVDREARGIELYSPAHDFELKGHATAIGRLDRLVAAHQLLEAHPLFEPAAIELEVS